MLLLHGVLLTLSRSTGSSYSRHGPAGRPGPLVLLEHAAPRQPFCLGASLSLFVRPLDAFPNALRRRLALLRPLTGKLRTRTSRCGPFLPSRAVLSGLEARADLDRALEQVRRPTLDDAYALPPLQQPMQVRSFPLSRAPEAGLELADLLFRPPSASLLPPQTPARATLTVLGSAGASATASLRSGGASSSGASRRASRRSGLRRLRSVGFVQVAVP